MPLSWEGAALSVLAVFVLLLVVRRYNPLAGSVFAFDAVRSARRSRLCLLRSAYALFLLVVLFLVYTRWFGHDFLEGLAGIMDEQALAPSDQARFAGSFFHTFLIVQFLVVVLLTPAFTGGALAEEHEQGTLPLLLTTQLEAREILLGKLLSRAGILGLLLLAGVPILALLQLLGGVDPALLLAGFVITLMTLVSTAALSLFCSAGAKQARVAVVHSYGLLFAMHMSVTLGCGSCVALFFSIGADDALFCFFSAGSAIWTYVYLDHLAKTGQLHRLLPLLLVGQIAMHTLVAFLFLRGAAARLRRVEPQPRPVTATATPPELLRFPRSTRPSVGESPLVWKEVHVGHGPIDRAAEELKRVVLVLGGLCLTGFFAFGLLALFVEDQLDREAMATLLGLILIPLVGTLLMLLLSLRGAGTISSERDRHTLDSLLTTDLSNRDILKQKWLGCLATQKWLLLILVLLVLFGLLSGGASWWTAPLLLASVAAQLSFALCLGIYCSLVCTSTFRATALTLTVLLSVTVGHWLLHAVTSALALLWRWPAPVREMLTALHTYGMTPPVNLGTIAEFGWNIDGAHLVRDAGMRLLGVVAGVAVYALLVAGLWWRLRARFGPITGRLR